ncbi:hypothetical protein PBI_LUCKY2013_159 [Mycobacterium phage Lucky2013]|uniref:MazG-like pyrophosphatase n=1 Tax=Mycobacterium phage MiaZeal TaxID=1567005 RepID=UPI0005407540|nr:MazG-like pyrophosphatase [Mycobacterium phage MiaZeal]AIY32520.1 hypothetical protein PBI_MIAZEAL_166 [Mycobacterium phage MiaZeal]ASD50781.1 hypothetical protein PORCELAIN_163 [Mycobacterium phage Porcelain]ASD53552.1 hypothetical protein PBI_LUCKY2013_159 [Mycobacterium phage Lucky2013]
MATVKHNCTYVSGPMSGLEDFNHPAFNAKAAELRAAGEEVINPAEFDAEIGPDQSWDTYLRRDLILLAQHCNKIVLLPGWQSSIGARLELHVAEQLGMTVVYPTGETVHHRPAGAVKLAQHREVFA